MSNIEIEEDYRLFKLVKRNPIKSCADLSKNMRGRKEGVFYFTELFRVEFENKMYNLERLKAEREADKKRIKELEEENTEIKNTKMNEYLHKNLWLAKHLNELYIPKQKVKEILDRLHITDIEPWSFYKVSGEILFDLKELLEDK